MPAQRMYWFRAKRYGWGWGLPMTWQGWMVLVAFVVLVVLAAIIFPPSKHLWSYFACVAVLGLLVLGICWLKGEPPRWRWGGDRE